MRLNANLKYKILNEALKRSNEQKAIDAAYKALSDFATKVITEYHGEDGLKEIEADAKKMHKLANKLADLSLTMRLEKTKRVWFSFAEEKPKYIDACGYRDVLLEVPMYCNRFIWVKSTELGLELNRLNAEIGKSKSALNDLRSTINGVLDSVTTVKKLLTVWEEAAELLPEGVTQPKKLLPTVDTTNLNKSLNLPTTK